MPMTGGGRRPADPRQLSDRGYITRSIRKLIIYLTEHGYDRAISPQILNAPTGKDFLQICSFLIRSIDPNFQFGRYEEEYPAVLRTLGYPSTISKASLAAVGTQHTWPHLLGSLTWLVDLLKYSEAAFQSELGDSFDTDDGNKVFMEYLSKAYQLFLAGEDDMSQLEEQIQFQFETKNASLSHDVETLTATNAELSVAVHELTAGDTPLQTAQRLNNDFRSDTAKFEKHINDLQDHRSRVADRLREAEASNSAKQQELAEKTAEIEKYRETISKQELTPADVSRMTSERDTLEHELAQLKEQKNNLNQQLWDSETANKTALQRLDAKTQQVNNCSVRLQMILAEGKNANGGNHLLELQQAELASRPERLLSIDVADALKSELARLKAEVARDVLAAQDALLEAEQQETQRELMKQERLEQLQVLNAELQRLEREEKLLREQHQREIDDCRRETEAVHAEILSTREVSAGTLLHSNAELASLQKEYDAFVLSSTHARKKILDQIGGMMNALLTHKDHITEQLDGLKDHISARAKQLEPLLARD